MERIGRVRRAEVTVAAACFAIPAVAAACGALACRFPELTRYCELVFMLLLTAAAGLLGFGCGRRAERAAVKARAGGRA